MLKHQISLLFCVVILVTSQASNLQMQVATAQINNSIYLYVKRPSNTSYLVPILSEIEQTLKAEGFEVKITEVGCFYDWLDCKAKSYPPNQPVLWINITQNSLDPSVAGFGYFWVFPFQVPDLQHKSPLIMTGYETSSGIASQGEWENMPNNDQLNAIKDLIIAESFYSASRCDLAQPYFETLKQSSFEMISDHLIPFYEGNCALLNSDDDTAIEKLTNAWVIEGFDDHWGYAAINNLAWVYIRQNHQQEALDLANRLIVVASHGYSRTLWGNSLYIDALFRHSQIYALTESYDEAIDDLTTAIELDSNNPELYIQRGKMYLAQYEWDSALADYNKAIELDPTYADAYYDRGVLYYSILQTGVELRAEAFDDFHRYLELAPDGDHAADAARFTAQIQKELEALNG